MRARLLLPIVCLAVPLCATAGIKAGQWEITMKMDLGKTMPQMPKLTPEQLAQMKQMGMQLPSMDPNAARTIKICVSPQDAASDRPPMDERAQRSCKPQDVWHDGNRTTLKIVCDGEMKGTGEVESVNDSDEHYTSKFHFVGTSHGHAVDIKHESEGRWLSASCK